MRRTKLVLETCLAVWIVDRHISDCENFFRVCMFIPLSQQTPVRRTVLQPLEMQHHGWRDPIPDGFMLLVF